MGPRSPGGRPGHAPVLPNPPERVRRGRTDPGRNSVGTSGTTRTCPIRSPARITKRPRNRKVIGRRTSPEKSRSIVPGALTMSTPRVESPLRGRTSRKVPGGGRILNPVRTRVTARRVSVTVSAAAMSKHAEPWVARFGRGGANPSPTRSRTTRATRFGTRAPTPRPSSIFPRGRPARPGPGEVPPRGIGRRGAARRGGASSRGPEGSGRSSGRAGSG